MEQLINLGRFITESFIHILPFLLITIPLAVIINLTGASAILNKIINRKPMTAILLATAIGAFSPFCSCGVIPVISSLLIGGVPLAPVMSFWIASPSMDPEIFFLSSSVLGLDLAIWRLAATFIISLLSGYITYFATVNGFIGADVLRLKSPFTNTCSCPASAADKPEWIKKLPGEIVKATLMVTKFMLIAFTVNALIKYYLPAGIISGITNTSGTSQVVLGALSGIPLYTTNITALPLVGGLLDLGLNKGAALAFLIAGSTTTLPAMVAVWGIASRKVFILYLTFSIAGSLLSGMIFNLFKG